MTEVVVIPVKRDFENERAVLVLRGLKKPYSKRELKLPEKYMNDQRPSMSALNDNLLSLDPSA